MGSMTSMSARGRVADGRAFVLAGAMLLAVAMGVGRFAYTPIIPIMERDAGLTVALAGTLASSNLFGYFVGSLLTILPALRARRLLAVRCAIATVVVTTAAMAIPSPLAWLVLRLVTGVASGVVLVFASSIVIDRAVAERRPAWPGLFFGGVGIGVALTGALAAPLAQIGGSRASWIGLAFISALAVALTVPSFTTTGPAALPSAATKAGSTRAPGFPWLAALYGIQGFSYVIPATFLVALVADTPATARFAASSWGSSSAASLRSRRRRGRGSRRASANRARSSRRSSSRVWAPSQRSSCRTPSASYSRRSRSAGRSWG